MFMFLRSDCNLQESVETAQIIWRTQQNRNVLNQQVLLPCNQQNEEAKKCTCGGNNKSILCK